MYLDENKVLKKYHKTDISEKPLVNILRSIIDGDIKKVDKVLKKKCEEALLECQILKRR